jgi:hypothetical protein
MKKKLLYLIISLFLNLNSFAIYHSEGSNPDSLNDGPYIFNVNDTLKVKWIENNVLREDYIMQKNFTEIKKKFNLLCNYKDLTDTYLLKSNYSQSYNRIDSISVISDVHGEYNIYINLLIATGIIDKNLNWKFGKGHLVVLGDIFDRGNMVTEILWHLYGLEKQAIKAGGMVHVLLGNHEVMVLNKDLSYINEKYEKVEVISNTKYFDLYSENSVLGKWLRSKPVVITINNIIFVHAGISIELVQRNLKIEQINQIISDKIIGKDIQSINENEELKFLNENNGPLWYRGYFYDTGFSESKLDSILDFYAKEHIVVGHTTFEEIKSLFNNKILGIDAGIMYKQPGEMLIYKNGFFYKGSITGNRIKL